MPVPQENNPANNENAEDNEEEMGEEEEEDMEEDADQYAVEHIPADPAAAMAEGREVFSLLLGVMLTDACRDVHQRAVTLDAEHTAKRAEALEADQAGQRARAAQLYLEAERIKTQLRIATQELDEQREVAGHNWIEELFRRVRQLEGYTGLNPDPAIRYEALRIVHYVSPQLYLDRNDTLRVQAFFHHDAAENPLNMGFIEDVDPDDESPDEPVNEGNSPQR